MSLYSTYSILHLPEYKVYSRFSKKKYKKVHFPLTRFSARKNAASANMATTLTPTTSKVRGAT